MSRLLKILASRERVLVSRKRSFAHVHWFRTAETCPRCRKIERTIGRYSVMNDVLAVIACAALGCGCGDPRCPTVVNAVLLANGSLPRAAGSQQDGDREDSGRGSSE
jgi:hypothetical protein